MTQDQATSEIKRLATQAATLLMLIRNNKGSKYERTQLGKITNEIVHLWPLSGAEDGDHAYITYLVNTYISERYRSMYPK